MDLQIKVTEIDPRQLLKPRMRIASWRARSWPSRIRVFRIILLALLGMTTVNVFKALVVLIYVPALIILRLLNFRFLYSRAMTRSFGHTAIDPAYYLKAQAIGVIAKHRTIIVVSRNRVPNPYLLEMWRSKFTLITHPALAFFLAPMKWSRLTGKSMFLSDFQVSFDGRKTLKYGPAVDEIERRYTTQISAEPLLTIDDELAARGTSVLETLGMQRNSWWVAMHMRESSYHDDISPRDVDPLSYLKSVQTIIDRGGYVVRLGDQGMKVLPKMEGLIDYAHSSAKSDWMDIFIIGGARFLLSSNSGPSAVANLLNVDVAAANWVPISQGILGWHGIRIPKLIVKDSPPSILSFETVLTSRQLRDIHTKEDFIQACVNWKDNTSEEINELTLEMLDYLEGKILYDATDEKLQERYQYLISSLPTSATMGTMSRVGKHFLKSHVDLFDTD
jgi:putative glycosyltransferase (TIGR04372 family)